MQKPSIGRVVIAVGGRAVSNGLDHCPAVVTRVWSERPDGVWLINATLLPDASEPVSATSICLYADGETARAARGPQGDERGVTAAHWPERV